VIDDSRNAADSVPQQRSRIDEIRHAGLDPYPRLAVDPCALTCEEFLERYKNLGNNETIEEESVVVYGTSGRPL
jgi:hypothetical protein